MKLTGTNTPMTYPHPRFWVCAGPAKGPRGHNCGMGMCYKRPLDVMCSCSTIRLSEQHPPAGPDGVGVVGQQVEVHSVCGPLGGGL